MKTLDALSKVWNCRKDIWLALKIRLDFISFTREWRLENGHNSTIPGCKFDIEKVSVGEGTYGTLNVHCWNNPEEQLNIGNYCSIADNVNFILGGMHPIKKITTFPYRSHVLKMPDNNPTGTKGPINIEDDVWICYGSTILSGVRIGKGSIIAAKSVVAKDVPPYTIYISDKDCRKRFPDEIIDKIYSIDLKNISKIEDKQFLEEVVDSEITLENVEIIAERLSN